MSIYPKLTHRFSFSILFIAFLFVFMPGLTVSAQKNLNVFVSTAKCSKSKNIALVIGNSNYESVGSLKSPVYDAEDMAKALRDLGFCVMDVLKDASKSAMESAISDFEVELRDKNKVGLFYYSGHGVQSKGSNYIIPVDANIPSEIFLNNRAINVEDVLEAMDENELNILILDACRNNPFEKSWRTKGISSKDGLSTIGAPSGTLIAYATLPNKVAYDGTERNSVYTRILLSEMNKKDVTILQMFSNVRQTLSKETNKKQVSWEANSIIGDYCLGCCGKQSPASTTSTTSPRTPPSRENTSDGISMGPQSTKNSYYTTTANKHKLRFHSAVIDSNSDEAIKKAVNKLIDQTDTEEWDDKWYYRSLPYANQGLLLVWHNGTKNTFGWLFLQQNKSYIWFYRTNGSNEFNQISTDKPDYQVWNTDGTTIKIKYEVPNELFWEKSDILYSFGD